MKSTRHALTVLAFTAFAAGLAAAQAPPASLSADRTLAGDKVCTECHDETDKSPTLGLYQTRHGVKGDARTPGCQTCHGPSAAHVKNQKLPTDVVFVGKNKAGAEAQSAVCLTCHKGGKRGLWEGSKHHTSDLSCNNCHKVHRTGQDKVLNKVTQSEVCYGCHKSTRAQVHRVSTHPIAEGKVACSDCHNTHGSIGPKLVKDESIRDTCFTCHAEKRGPFLHQHAGAMDDCMNCHAPHGSTNMAMLKGRQPWLCQECHGDAAPHPGAVYSGNNLPGGAQANANQTGGLRSQIGSGSSFIPPTPLNLTNPVTGAPITSNAGSAQIAMRGCTNCHAQIHGSNHPGGQRFTR
jgi:DmsE family decaheme c-type cytochrome